METKDKPFWETGENPITGYVVPSNANYRLWFQERLNILRDKWQSEY